MSLCNLQQNIETGKTVLTFLVIIVLSLIAVTVYLRKKNKQGKKKWIRFAFITFVSIDIIAVLLTLVCMFGQHSIASKKTAVYDYVKEHTYNGEHNKYYDFIAKYPKLVKVDPDDSVYREGKTYIKYEKNNTTMPEMEIKKAEEMFQYQVEYRALTTIKVKCNDITFKMPKVATPKVLEPLCVKNTNHTKHVECASFRNDKFTPDLGLYLDEETQTVYLIKGGA